MKNSLFFNLCLSISLVLLSVAISLACSCVWPIPAEHFCRSVNESDHIVLAVVTAKSEEYEMEVKVIDNLNLQTSEDTISILGQDGFNCGEWLNDFLIGDTLVLGLQNGQFFEISTNVSYDWFISICGLHYLRYSNGMVLGEIDFGEDSISYEIFADEILDCMELSSSIDDGIIESELTLSPNPTSDYLNININFNQRVEYYFEILDISGTTIRRDIKIDAANNRIDVSYMSTGVYFLRSRNTPEVATKKFIKI